MSKNTITINLDPILRSLSRLELKNFPFAEAMALNKTAFQAKDALVAQMPRKFDLRSNRLKKGFRVNKANKKQTTRESSVTHLDSWMSLHEMGGKKRPAKDASSMGVPAEGTLKRGRTASGKIREGFWPRNLLKNEGSTDPQKAGAMGGRGNKGKGRVKAFMVKHGGHQRIVTREKRGADREKLVGLYTLATEVKVEPRWDFEKTVRGVAKNKLAKNFQKAMARAVETSKK